MDNSGHILSIVLRILAVLVLVMLNGFFVAAEFSLVKVRETQLNPLILQGQRRAKLAGYILQRLDSFLSAAQLGITLASLGLGWIGEPVFTALLGPVFGWLNVESDRSRRLLSFVFGFTALTFLHISAGEQAPKWMAIQRPVQSALWVAYPMYWFYRVSYPLVVALNWTSQWLLRQVGLSTGGEERAQSEEEVRLLFATSGKGAGRGTLGRDIVLNALDLRRRVVRDVMRPRQEMVVFDTESTIAQCLEIAEKSRYSRFPLCENGDPDKTLGVIHIKDLYALRIKATTAADLRPAVRKLIYVPETARLERLLQFFLERKLHLAVVVDEYGGTLGMATLENILEELVGQIQDEFDQEKPLLTRIADDVWEADGALPIHELEELAGEPLRQEGITSVSGWVTQRLGGFPKVGDVITVGICELRVEELEGLRVARLKLTRRTSASAPANEPAN